MGLTSPGSRGILSALIITMATEPAVRAADWPNYRGPDHNGVSKEAGWRTAWPAQGPKTLWKASLGPGFASMAVCGGRVYAMGNVQDRDVVYCLDAVTGKEVWRQSYPCPLFAKMHEGGPCATPTVQGGQVYVFSKNGDVLCMDANTGQVVWHKNLVKDLGLENLTWYFSGSPLIVDDLLILNAGKSGVALRKADGGLAWQNGTDPGGYASPVPYEAAGRKAAILFACREVFGVDAATGKVLWSHPWRTDYDINAADPIMVEDKVFISSGYNTGCALLKIDSGQVTEVWRNKAMRNECYGSVPWEGSLYGFDGQVGGSGKLTCMDAGTGQVRWSQAGMGTGTLMIADGRLVILSERGKLVIAKASPERFEELASAQILTGKCWTVPVLANGLIYARNAAGDLVCVDVRP